MASPSSTLRLWRTKASMTSGSLRTIATPNRRMSWVARQESLWPVRPELVEGRTLMTIELLGGLGKRRIHLLGSEESQLAAVGLGVRIVRDLRGELAEIRAGDDLGTRLFRQSEGSIAAAVLCGIEEDVRCVHLLGGPILFLVERVDLARLGEELRRLRLELGSGVAFELTHHGLCQEGIDLE